MVMLRTLRANTLGASKVVAQRALGLTVPGLMVLLSLACTGTWAASPEAILDSATRAKPGPIGGAKPGAKPAATTGAKPAAVNCPVADKWAVVIGISNFQDQSLNLKYSAKDAKDFADYLVSEANFKPDHVKLLIDKAATRENILSLLGDKWLPRVALPDDLVVIYISSHGSPASLDVAGLNYLVVYNTDKDNLFATGIPINHLAQIIRERVHSNRVVLALDACHSGAADTDGKGLYRVSNFNASDFIQGEGQLVICSSEPTQISWESKNYANGVFTRKLIAGLRQRGTVTPLGEAFEFTKQQVQQEVARDRGVLQTPVLKSNWDGHELLMAAPPAKPRPGLDESLTMAAPVAEIAAVTGGNAAVPGGAATVAGGNAAVPSGAATVTGGNAAVPGAAATVTGGNATVPSGASVSGAPGTASGQAGLEKSVAPKSDADMLFDKIPPVWHVKERSMGLHFDASWTYNKDKKEFDGLWDNGTQSTLEIVQYDGHHIILARRNYAGDYKGNRYRYEGTVEANRASGTYTMVNLRFLRGKWEASW